ELENLAAFQASNTAARGAAKVIGIVLHDAARIARSAQNGDIAPHAQTTARARLKNALEEKQAVREHLLQIFELVFSPASAGGGGETKPDAQAFMSLLARQLPNEVRVEMVRIARDRTAQIEIA